MSENLNKREISAYIHQWLEQGLDCTSITLSKRGGSIKVKVEINGTPQQVFPALNLSKRLDIKLHNT